MLPDKLQEASLIISCFLGALHQEEGWINTKESQQWNNEVVYQETEAAAHQGDKPKTSSKSGHSDRKISFSWREVIWNDQPQHIG